MSTIVNYSRHFKILDAALRPTQATASRAIRLRFEDVIEMRMTLAYDDHDAGGYEVRLKRAAWSEACSKAASKEESSWDESTLYVVSERRVFLNMP